MVVSSLRHICVFKTGKCPYIKRFIALCRDIYIIFQNLEEYKKFFNWNNQLYEIEKKSLLLFIEKIFQNFQDNQFYTIEDVMREEYFDGKPFKDLATEFLEETIESSPSRISEEAEDRFEGRNFYLVWLLKYFLGV